MRNMTLRRALVWLLAFGVIAAAIGTFRFGGPQFALAQTDSPAPTVSSIAITSNPDDDIRVDGMMFDSGVYGIADSIQVTVTFSEHVTVTGAPQLELNIGGSARTAAYETSDGSAVVFSYTVAEGDSATDGVAIRSNKLTLNGGNIKSATDNDADLSHSALAAQEDHKIDGVRPMALINIDAQTGGSDGYFTYGEELLVGVTWSERVLVSGTPQLSLDFDGSTRTATWDRTGFGDYFTYEIQEGDLDADGVAVGSNSIDLNGGTFRDYAGNDALLTHAGVSPRSYIKVDAVSPAVSSIEITSEPDEDDTYGTGEKIEVTVTFTENVTVPDVLRSDGPSYRKPQLELDIGGEAKTATYQSNEGTQVLFAYSVQAGDTDDDGIAIGANKLAMNGGAILDDAGNNPVSPSLNLVELPLDAVVNHGSLADDPNHKVDGSSSGLSLSGSSTISYRENGTHVVETYSVSGADGAKTWSISGDDSSDFSINRGWLNFRSPPNYEDPADSDSDNRYDITIEVTAGAKSAILDVTVTVTNRWLDSDEVPFITGTAQVGQTLTADVSRISNYAEATFWYTWIRSDGDTDTYISDTSNVENARSPTYTLTPEDEGKKIKVLVVSVDYGTPTFRRTSAPTDTVVAAGQQPDPADEEGTSESGEEGEPAPTEPADTTAPTVSSLAVTSDTDNDIQIDGWMFRNFDAGVYGIGDSIQVTVSFSDGVTVTGEPHLEIDVGGSARAAAYESSDGSTVRFGYTVAEGDSDTDGISIAADSLSLNGGSITGSSGDDADLSHSALPAQTNHRVDGIRPSAFISISSQTGSSGGYFTFGEELLVNVAFTEKVFVSGTPQLSLDFDGATRTATWDRTGFGDYFTYEIQEGDLDADGVVVRANSISLNGGGIKDRAGNDATLNHAGVAANADFKVDGVAPTVSSIAITSDPGDDDTYGTGDRIVVTVAFSEYVTVLPVRRSDAPGVRHPQLELNVGGEAKTATYYSHEGSLVRFAYSVAEGDADEDGISIGANKLSLNGGVILDAAGNNPVSVALTSVELPLDAVVTHEAVDDNPNHKVSTAVAQEADPVEEDRPELIAFYEATGGPGWTNSGNWLSDAPIGQWHGVTTDSDGRVTHLSLRSNNLSGTLSSDLGKLERLEVLALDRNGLTGAIPAELGNLQYLTQLALNRNNLSGAIPSELGNLPNLSIIGLARNHLSGPLPTKLGNLSGLTKLSLHDNTGLSGPLPAGIGEMSGLTRLAVSRTGLSGRLPQGLVNSAMQYLHFDDTGLCAPANEGFQDWLDGVADKDGPNCAPPTVTVSSADPLTLREGGVATYMVVLGAQPAGSVVVQATSNNADVTVQPANLTFTPSDWQTARTVTVSAAQDDDAADDAATISHHVSGDDEYAGIAVASVAVAVTDDDTAAEPEPLDAPVLTVSAGDGQIDLSWGPVPNAAAYTVAWTGGGDTGSDTTAETGYTITGLTNGQEYTVVVTANPADGSTEYVSSASDPITVVPVAPISFGGAALDEYRWQQNVAVHLDLPAATGGAGPLTYRISPELPDGLVFDTDALTITGKPTGTQDRANYAYEASDSAGGFFFLFFSIEVLPDPVEDRPTLMAFYQATGGAGWTNSGNWLSEAPIGEWHGVTTDAEGRVTHLSLRDNNLSGSLPAALGKMTHLEVISLDRNNLDGSLPAALGNLVNLTRLALNRNQLTGSIPAQLGNLSNLSIIGLANNNLTGGLPTGWGNISGLTRLSLHDNTELSGPLPDGFATNVDNLQRLAVANTGLCAPDTEAFRDWLDTVPDKPGGVATCE